MPTPPAATIDLEGLGLEAFRDQPVAVLGLARSGVALTRFLADHGARVVDVECPCGAGTFQSGEHRRGLDPVRRRDRRKGRAPHRRARV